MTSRVKKLRNYLLSCEPTLTAERASIVTEAYEKYQSEHILVKRALVFRDVLSKMVIRIYPNELFVGHQAGGPRLVALFPEFSCKWIEKDLDHFEFRTGDRFYISDENKDAIRRVLVHWQGKTLEDRVLCSLPEEAKRALDARIFINPVYNSGVGHIIPDYPMVVAVGIRGVLDRIEAELSGLDMTNPSDIAKYNFLKSSKISCEAAIAFSLRYADLAEEMLKTETDPRRKEELLTISKMCRKVPECGAESFYEALQSFWMVHLLFHIESNGYAVSPARFDQYMYPYYKADIDKGIITKDEAQELLDSLWIKFNEILKVREELSTLQAGGQPMFQNLIIGGQDKFGYDMANELSYMCIQSEENVRLPQPSFSIRYHQNTAHEFMKKVANLVKLGTGKPAMYNDITIIPSLINRNIPLEDAREYAIVGCVEQSIPGKTYGGHGASKFNLAKVLELTLNNGFDPVSKIQIGPKTGNAISFKSYNELMTAYNVQHTYCIQQMIILEHVIEECNMQMVPIPFMSSFISDCIKKGKDVMEGGAHYNFVGPEGVGVATVADSLACIKKLVFEEKKLSMTELTELLANNFEGNELKRQLFLNRAPKYGNDDNYADLIAREIAAKYCYEVEQYKGVRGGVFSPGLYTTTNHVPMGAVVGATPDGRLAKTPLNDGVSPAQGRDISGPTASLKSVTKLDQILVSNGILLNFKIDPLSIQDDVSLEKFISMLKTYFNLGGQHIQINCVCADTLRDAQKNPENYADLVIRVAGYSAFFTSLDKSLQDDLITRTEHHL